MAEVLSPAEGGCWYCQLEIKPEENAIYSGEFDSNLHVDCLKRAYNSNPNDLEARIIMAEASNYIDLFVDSKGGKTYSGSEFIFTEEGYFAIKPSNTDTDLEVMPLVIDGVINSAISIDTYHLTLVDFEELPLNQYGLKTVALNGQEELMLTANGYFVQYSWGLPSIVGLPSEIQELSPVYRRVKFPEFLSPVILFTKGEYMEHLNLLSEVSFYKEEVFEYVDESYLNFACHTDILEPKVATLSRFYPALECSKYYKLFPGYTAEQAKIYDGVFTQATQKYRTH